MEDQHIAGRWSGKFSSSANPEYVVELDAAIALLPSGGFPSIFGASADGDLVIGTYAAESRKATFRVSGIAAGSDDGTLVFTGTVFGGSGSSSSSDAAVVRMAGTWNQPSSGVSGMFGLMLVEPGASLAGVWKGEAVPAPELAPFCIPTNPITWVLAPIPDRGDAVVGAGFFDDAADVPGQPVIAFTVTGTCTVEGDENKLKLVKQYEYNEAVENYAVDYVGVWDKSAQAVSGSWRNELGGSHGSFHARRLDPSTAVSAATLVCAECATLCTPGDEFHECIACRSPGYIACAACAPTSPHTASAGAGHTLDPQRLYAPQQVRGETCAELVVAALDAFASRPFIASRSTGGWLTYADIAATARGWTRQLAPHAPAGKVVLLGDMSPAYVSAMVGTIAAGVVVVPIDGALPIETLAAVGAKVAPVAVLCSADYVAKAEAMNAGTVIVYEEDATDGASPDDESPGPQLEIPARDRGDLAALLFTSGSTGVPKGAMYTEAMLLPTFAGGTNMWRMIRLDFQAFHPSFIVSLLALMSCGGSRFLATDPTTLLEDMTLARATHISAPPLLFSLLRKAYDEVIRQTASREAGLARVRACLGNRLVSLISGGGAIAPSTLDFFRNDVGVTVDDLLGSREAGPLAKNGELYPSVTPLLLDVESLEPSVPLAVGAVGVLAVASPRLIPGYYDDEARSARAFTTVAGTRYYITGDVVRVLSLPGPLRNLKIALEGRVGYGCKLANAKWLAPDALEAVLEAAPWVLHALVVARPGTSAPVAIIVPSHLAPTDVDPPSMLAELRFWCTHHHSQFTLAAVALEHERWSHANGMLTATAKKARAALHACYKTIIDALYDAPAAPKGADVALSPIMADLLRTSIGVDVDDSGRVDASVATSTLLELGGDSLALAQLVGKLQKAGVALSMADAQMYSVAHLDGMALRASESVGAAAALPRSVRRAVNWSAEVAMPMADLTPVHKASTSPSKSVLLTGATGFLGRALLLCLLNDASVATVVVLVRDPGRLDPAAACDPRVEVLVGDLGEAQLGLDDIAWAALLGRDLTAIIHAGAAVNMVLAYEALQRINVGGTKTMVGVAAATNARLVHVSSVAALPAAEFAAEGWIALPSSDDMDKLGGYAASKVVAEAVVHEASQAGLDVVVARLSSLSAGPDGVANPADVLTHLLELCKEMGVGPRGGLSLDWMPVDVAARVVVGAALIEGAPCRRRRRCMSSGTVHRCTWRSIAPESPSGPRPTRGVQLRKRHWRLQATDQRLCAAC
ncbi:fatty-acid-coa ligase FadD [Thecamonas trahens ATCC 50062]|uniref:Fatty-acid-coa ligase FadD n=1 Tax=Thecamonas trahens ATCC 50062 TaxID=461836 RepID=A0A0L0DBB0_THETB|nr:fatty-acid-coa ligase FadD [Thecamonas trahens ATCC 50062]KNC48563.1 fatty-acid-coa ligase FadD [Thecamonas trahens ATCC 50062]|eukprot:XP_013762619.1 fatty-acid-coa ligase FadD [Thecamonas trahens ATCC 50062]